MFFTAFRLIRKAKVGGPNLSAFLNVVNYITSNLNIYRGAAFSGKVPALSLLLALAFCLMPLASCLVLSALVANRFVDDTSTVGDTVFVDREPGL